MLHPAMLHLAMLHPAMLHQSSSFITLHLQPLHRHSLHWALTPAMPCTHKINTLSPYVLYQVPGALRSWHVDDMGGGMLSMFLTHACKFSVMYAQHYGQETRR